MLMVSYIRLIAVLQWYRREQNRPGPTTWPEPNGLSSALPSRAGRGADFVNSKKIRPRPKMNCFYNSLTLYSWYKSGLSWCFYSDSRNYTCYCTLFSIQDWQKMKSRQQSCKHAFTPLGNVHHLQHRNGCGRVVAMHDELGKAKTTCSSSVWGDWCQLAQGGRSLFAQLKKLPPPGPGETDMQKHQRYIQVTFLLY